MVTIWNPSKQPWVVALPGRVLHLFPGAKAEVTDKDLASAHLQALIGRGAVVGLRPAAPGAEAAAKEKPKTKRKES